MAVQQCSCETADARHIFPPVRFPVVPRFRDKQADALPACRIDAAREIHLPFPETQVPVLARDCFLQVHRDQTAFPFGDVFKDVEAILARRVGQVPQVRIHAQIGETTWLTNRIAFSPYP